MVWITAGKPHPEVSVFLTEGYLPDRSTIDEVCRNHIKNRRDDLNAFESFDEEVAWMLSALTRRHVGYSHKMKDHTEDLSLPTWVINQSTRGENGFLDHWFNEREDVQNYRLYLHACPRQQFRQFERKLLFNIFAYAHTKLKIKRGTFKGKRDPVANTVISEVATRYAENPSAAEKYLSSLGHPLYLSEGRVARSHKSLP